MGFTRRDGIVWSVCLGALTAITVGAAAYPPAIQLQGTLVAFLIVTPALYWLVRRRYAQWTAISPLVQISMYFLSLFGGLLVVATLVYTLGGSGLTPLRIIGPVGAFGCAVYASFYGGADRLRRAVVARTGIDW